MTIDWVVLAAVLITLLMIIGATFIFYTTIAAVVEFFDDVSRIRAAVESIAYEDEDTEQDEVQP
jgi:membrane protein implicated in regulation of membrane protease activity